MDLADKIRKIEALIAGAKSEGERQAAELAKQRIQGKVESKPIEYTVRVASFWGKQLFRAICHKHRLQTYRYARQKYTTTMVRTSKSFMDSVLWPEYKKYDAIFKELAEDIVKSLISQIFQSEKEEEEIIISGELPAFTEGAAL